MRLYMMRRLPGHRPQYIVYHAKPKLAAWGVCHPILRCRGSRSILSLRVLRWPAGIHLRMNTRLPLLPSAAGRVPMMCRAAIGRSCGRRWLYAPSPPSFLPSDLDLPLASGRSG